MKDRAKVVGVFLVFLVMVSLSHLFVHLAFYGTGVRGFAERGISGFAVEGNPNASGLPISEIILFLEWGLIFLGVLFVYAKHKIDLKREFNDLKLLKDKTRFHDGTELDNFYELLQEVKHFRLLTAAKVFNVDEEIIEDWAKSLEAGQVAELTYPRIGGPEIRLQDPRKLKKKSEEDEDESEANMKTKERAAGKNADEAKKTESATPAEKNKEDLGKNSKSSLIPSTERNKGVKS